MSFKSFEIKEVVMNIYRHYINKALLRVNIKYLDQHSEAVVRKCSVKKVFLEISQNSHENKYAKDSFFNKRLTVIIVIVYSSNVIL